jgi:hypothetical protein
MNQIFLWPMKTSNTEMPVTQKPWPEEDDHRTASYHSQHKTAKKNAITRKKNSNISTVSILNLSYGKTIPLRQHNVATRTIYGI